LTFLGRKREYLDSKSTINSKSRIKGGRGGTSAVGTSTKRRCGQKGSEKKKESLKKYTKIGATI